MDLRQIRSGDVEFFKVDADALQMLIVFEAEKEVSTLNSGDVRKRIIGAVDDSGGSFAALDFLVTFGASHVLAIVATNEI